MGVFTQRPEEPSPWAALPSEPERAETEAERPLPHLPASPADPALLLGGLGQSVSVPLSAQQEPTAEDSAST